MAWLFQLAIECGASSSVAARVKAHFDGVTRVMIDRSVLQFDVNAIDQDEHRRWWVSVVPAMGSRTIQPDDGGDLIREVKAKLYERLSTVSEYRFALAGVEAFQFNDWEAIPSIIEHRALDGLVVQEKLFRCLGDPGGFVQFTEGYFWRPF